VINSHHPDNVTDANKDQSLTRPDTSDLLPLTGRAERR
jgi:hypothetical protein